jgi:hypothetical protein
MVTSFTGGCPDDRSILTYSESENPNSPYFADQTRMFSKKQWVDPPFCPSELDGLPGQVITDGSAAGGAAPVVVAKRRKCRPRKKKTKHPAVSSRRCHHKKKKRR